MNRNRYLLCLLLCCGMVYYAIPKLSLFATGVKGAFASAWLLFAMIVIAGNLSALLYTPKRQKNDRGTSKKLSSKRKIRSFHG
ncbi:hypothetical protein [Bacillus sp. 1NLA3E]|uniref:hypothetical protein n=1 Tax=Bacillus sp. 1NLA3E TaxID=666686 RepID=UPI000247E7A5|nr:hypothetical protein [Bacillus sp. 1NLA3E]